MTFTVHLPLPSKALSPNDRSHWGVRARAAKAYRQACAMAFLVARPRDWKPQRVVIDVEYRAHRDSGGYHAHDAANAMASLKAGIDGMQDASIIVTDSNKNLQWGGFKLLTTKAEVLKAGGAGVFVTVRPA